MDMDCAMFAGSQAAKQGNQASVASIAAGIDGSRCNSALCTWFTIA